MRVIDRLKPRPNIRRASVYRLELIGERSDYAVEVQARQLGRVLRVGDDSVDDSVALLEEYAELLGFDLAQHVGLVFTQLFLMLLEGEFGVLQLFRRSTEVARLAQHEPIGRPAEQRSFYHVLSEYVYIKISVNREILNL
jgi:hypothetical protein